MSLAIREKVQNLKGAMKIIWNYRLVLHMSKLKPKESKGYVRQTS